jgi:hypothetical protein
VSEQEHTTITDKLPLFITLDKVGEIELTGRGRDVLIVKDFYIQTIEIFGLFTGWLWRSCNSPE